ncbi:MAG: outer membrane beta-barrel protein [Woeseiaceae bacterium]|nr:outer membrane beta-barrel protein [Woeseiaceae bacterium]
MRFEKLFRALFPFLLAASLASSPDCHAGDFYVGADLQRTFVDETVDLDGASVLLDGETSGVRVAAGYRFNDYFATELAHTDFGSLEQTALGLSLSADASAQELAIIGRIPLGDRFALAGRVAYVSWDGDIGVDSVTAGISGDDLAVGVGMDVAVRDNLSLTLSGTRYRLDDLDLAVLGFGVRFSF